MTVPENSSMGNPSSAPSTKVAPTSYISRIRSNHPRSPIANDIDIKKMSNYNLITSPQIDPVTGKEAIYILTLSKPNHKLFSCRSGPPIQIKPREIDFFGEEGPRAKLLRNTENMMKLVESRASSYGLDISIDVPDAQSIHDKLMGSLDKNCLSEADLSLVEPLMKEDNTENRSAISKIIKEYVCKIILDNPYPGLEDIAQVAADMLIPQVVDVIFEKDEVKHE